MTIIDCERLVLDEIQIGEVIGSYELRKRVIKKYYQMNEKTTHVYAETLIKKLRMFRQTGEYYFKCIDRHKSIYQRIS